MLHPPTNFAVYLLIIFCAPLPTDRQTNITWEITSSAEVKNMKTTRGKQESSSNRPVRSFSCLSAAESPRAAVLNGDWKRYSVPLGVGSDIVQQSLCLKHTEALSDNSSCVQRINSWQNLCFLFSFFYSNHSHSVGKNTGATNNINDSSFYLNARTIWQPAKATQTADKTWKCKQNVADGSWHTLHGDCERRWIGRSGWVFFHAVCCLFYWLLIILSAERWGFFFML